MKSVLAILFFIAIIVFWIWLGLRVIVSYQQEAHIVSLEAQIKDVIAKHNDVNHKLIESRIRNEELSSSNVALIKVCNPSQFRKVAKYTPLPKMKG